MGCGEVVNTGDFDSSIRWFKSNQPSNSLIYVVFCGNGGTGRRPRLKIWYLMMCEFKPHFPHYRACVRLVEEAVLKIVGGCTVRGFDSLTRRYGIVE